ncbi:hypothetical protein Tco_0814626 [Tanacetum coccineum]
MSSYNHFGCSWCGGPFNGGNCPGCSSVGSGNELVYDPNPYSYNETPNFFNQPPQPQYETYSCEYCGNDSHYGFDCPPRGPHESFQRQPMNQNLFEHNSNYSGFDQPPQYSINHQEDLNQQRISDAANISTYTPEPSRHFNFTCDDDDDDEEYSIPLKDMPQISPSIALVSVSFIMEPEDSLIMGNKELSTIPEKESGEFIKSSVEDLILIPREFEDASGSDSESVLPLSYDFSPIFEEKSMTFSNPLFDSNNDFTSSDDESLSNEDVPEDVKIYSNSLFEFDDEYISSDVNPLFNKDECLAPRDDIECKVSYDSNLDESTFLVTPLSDSKSECPPLNDIELLLHQESSIKHVDMR